MSVRLAFQENGWNGSGVYGDFEACGRVADVDGEPLTASDYEGHLHEIPLVPSIDPFMAMFGFEPDEVPTPADLIQEAKELLVEYGWDADDMTVVESLTTV
jgi:hypothetical protein